MIDGNQISEVEWGDSDITIYLKSSAEAPVKNPPVNTKDQYSQYLSQMNVRYYVVPVNADAENLVDRMLRHGVEIYKLKPDNSGYIMEAMISIVIPFVLIFVIMNMTMRRMGNGGGGLMGVGKSTAKMYMQKETGVTFKDVAGEDEAKESLVEIVDFLHNPTKYTAIG
ncbi:MAG: ATP-dependent metallopeptidase HflB, partial [Butyrivibrio sp.]|nr:ATP-dependent metallopeptidase HflB [Butyrivibrio sp.]